MASLYDTLYAIARRTSSFTEFLGLGADGPDSKLPEPGDLIYRLKHWPHLPHRQKTADVLRTLSVMSHRPVNRKWILASSRLNEKQVDSLLARLVDQGAVEVTDTSQFARAAR
ncbi:hypothetical protein [Ramlibacter albus]|uniref:Uncharacterized protein n=1 Tax=Ramlibacter albus TaxID=2079448 RepID=A0A923MEA6_9BURK|nr:hypothetical protein [Ramlibacter albus]MBC5767908.1 hypothetical protein [Ramlibacter albus]